MADYDEGEITERERLAADRQKQLGRYNANSVGQQGKEQVGNYDFANRQNRQLADVELKQASRKSEDEKFEANRQLLNAAISLFGAMGPTTFQGSSLGNAMRMLENRNDADNNSYWSQLQQNWDQINNAYDESANQNQAAKRDVLINVGKAIRDIQSDTAANQANINPNLFESPGEGDLDFSNGVEGLPKLDEVAEHNAQLSGYLMPENSVQAARAQSPRNKLVGTDYFSRLINKFNGR